MAPHPKRSKAETAFVQLLLDVLRTVNDAISTATGPVSWSLADRGTGSRLLDAWPNMIPASLRPPRITLFEGMSNTEYRPYAYGNRRAMDRGYARSLHPAFASDWLWGDMQLGKEWLRTFPVTRGRGDDGWTLPNWGTLQ